MFGYIRPRKDELRIKDYDRYHSAYCGLCRHLGKTYGFPARFLVNYDMTFLYLLLSGGARRGETRRCWCPARCLGKKPCIRDEEGYAEVGARTVIFCWHKLADDTRDGGFFKRAGCRLLRLVYRRAHRKAAKLLPDFDRLCEQELGRLSTLEAERCPDLDRVCDPFAVLVQSCGGHTGDPAQDRPQELLLYQLGRFIYLADALDDLAEDLRNNQYNPLQYRFGTQNGALRTEDLDYLTQLIEGSINLCGSALELLDLGEQRPVLENIVYLGLSAVFSAVKQGRFHHKDKI